MQLTDVAKTLREQDDVRVVILHGVDGCFSAGADKNETRFFPEKIIPSHFRRSANMGFEMVSLWNALPQVTIAAIEGPAVGGGLSLAMACDMRIMGTSAFAFVPEVDLNVVYGWRSVPRLISLIGPSRTKRLILLTEKVSAARCYEWGLADEVVPDGQVMLLAQKWAETIAEKPPMPTRLVKSAVDAISTVFDRIGAHADTEQMLASLMAARLEERD